MNSIEKNKPSLSKVFKNLLSRLLEGLFDKNPILVQLLGTCPMLAITTSVGNAIGMGLSVICVLTLSNFLISLLRKFIPEQVRIASYVVIISGVVTAIELLIKAYFPAIDASLGIFIPLIVVNCIILARAEAYASKNDVFNSILDGIFMGAGYAFALLIVGSIREILGSGTWLGIEILKGYYKPMSIFVMPAGAFLTLGCVIAAVNAIRSKISKSKGGKA